MNMDNASSSSSNSMTASIQQAIYVNNEGTRLVRQSQYDSAVQSFIFVLDILKPLAVIAEDDQKHNSYNQRTSSSAAAPLAISFTNKSMDTTTDTFDDNDSNNDTTMTSSSASASRTSSASLSTSTSTSTEFVGQHHTQQKSEHFVFRDPVVIPPESLPSSASSALLSKFLMIVTYNLALTFHLHALSLSSQASSSLSLQASTSLSSGKDSIIRQLFAQSQQIYELALKMHLELDDDVDVDPLFTLALTNNLGLIYRIMNETDRSTICFQNMFSTMIYLLDSNSPHSHESYSIIKECIWDGLLSNAMNILFKHTHARAAAAA